jgi:hypothetical protein
MRIEIGVKKIVLRCDNYVGKEKRKRTKNAVIAGKGSLENGLS